MSVCTYDRVYSTNSEHVHFLIEFALVIQILILVRVTFAGTRSNSSDNIFEAVLREEEEFKQEMTSQCDAVMSKRDDPMTYCTIVCQVWDDNSKMTSRK